MSTFHNWELFSDKEINDASQAFGILATNYNIACFAEEEVIKKFMKTLASDKTPEKTKLSIVKLLALKVIGTKLPFDDEKPSLQKVYHP